MTVSIEKTYCPSHDIVARDIDGDIIIIPISAGVGSLEDELYTLNQTGSEVWNYLDGKRSLSQVIDLLAHEYDISSDEIQADVVGLLNDLYQRRIVVEVA